MALKSSVEPARQKKKPPRGGSFFVTVDVVRSAGFTAYRLGLPSPSKAGRLTSYGPSASG